MSRIARFVAGIQPVPGAAWRDVRDHAPVVVSGGAWPLVLLEDGRSLSVLCFLLDFEPVLPAADGDWLEEAMTRAEVRALSQVSPTESYPLTFSTAWQGTTLEERQAQAVLSWGYFCSECGPAGGPEADEVIRMARHTRCRCGEPTRWYHLAGERRTRAELDAIKACGAPPCTLKPHG